MASLMDGLVYGPPCSGTAVQHVHLSAGIDPKPDQDDRSVDEPLHKFTIYLIDTILTGCPRVASATVYGE